MSLLIEAGIVAGFAAPALFIICEALGMWRDGE